MQPPISLAEALARLSPAPRFVILMCGLAGSGKTTFSQRLEVRGFDRISIDETIWNSAGQYGVDYPREAYGSKVSAAREHLKFELARLLKDQRSVVVDSAFWSRTHRDDFVSIVSAHGGRHQIVFLKASKELLKGRLSVRSARFDANAALPIDDAVLEQFAASFEEPVEDENPLIVAA